MKNGLDSDDYFGVNEKGLYELCLKIEKYSDDLSTIFNEIDKNMEEIKDCYQSSSSSLITTSYNDFRKNYGIIKKNINSYSKDLNAVVKTYKSGVHLISLNVNADAEDVRNQTKAEIDRRDF